MLSRSNQEFLWDLLNTVYQYIFKIYFLLTGSPTSTKTRLVLAADLSRNWRVPTNQRFRQEITSKLDPTKKIKRTRVRSNRSHGSCATTNHVFEVCECLRKDNNVICMSSACHLYVICMSPVCHLYVTCMSPVCHLYVICMSSVCHLYVICMSSVCRLYVTCMSPVCHLYVVCCGSCIVQTGLLVT